MLNEIKKNPGKVKIGFSPGLGNDDQLSFVRAADMYGVDPFNIQYLQYESSEELIQALIRHEIDAASMTHQKLKHMKEAAASHLGLLLQTKGFPHIRMYRRGESRASRLYFPIGEVY